MTPGFEDLRFEARNIDFHWDQGVEIQIYVSKHIRGVREYLPEDQPLYQVPCVL